MQESKEEFKDTAKFVDFGKSGFPRFVERTVRIYKTAKRYGINVVEDMTFGSTKKEIRNKTFYRNNFQDAMEKGMKLLQENVKWS